MEQLGEEGNFMPFFGFEVKHVFYLKFKFFKKIFFYVFRLF